MSGTRRGGLTKIEVLMAGGSLLVLFFLFMMSFPRHEPRRRNQCATNLKNLALAAMQYENHFGRLPGYIQDYGTYVAADPAVDPSDTAADSDTLISHRKVGSWAVALLPWLDAQPTYEHWTIDRYPIAFGGSEEFPLSRGAGGYGFTSNAAPSLAIFQCPQDQSVSETHGRNSYVCSAGMYHRSSNGDDAWQIERDGETITIDFSRSMSIANGAFNNKLNAVERSGDPMPIGPNVTLEDFKDGQGYTMLFTENLQAIPWHRAGLISAADLAISDQITSIFYPETSRYTQGVVWHYEDSGGVAGAPHVKPVHKINGTPAGKNLDQLAMSAENCADLARPSSNHVQGVNMAFADGMVRFVTDSIDYRVYQAMLTPNGKRSDVPMPEFVLTSELE